MHGALTLVDLKYYQILSVRSPIKCLKCIAVICVILSYVFHAFTALELLLFSHKHLLAATSAFSHILYAHIFLINPWFPLLRRMSADTDFDSCWGLQGVIFFNKLLKGMGPSIRKDVKKQELEFNMVYRFNSQSPSKRVTHDTSTLNRLLLR